MFEKRAKARGTHSSSTSRLLLCLNILLWENCKTAVKNKQDSLRIPKSLPSFGSCDSGTCGLQTQEVSDAGCTHLLTIIAGGPGRVQITFPPIGQKMEKCSILFWLWRDGSPPAGPGAAGLKAERLRDEAGGSDRRLRSLVGRSPTLMLSRPVWRVQIVRSSCDPAADKPVPPSCSRCPPRGSSLRHVPAHGPDDHESWVPLGKNLNKTANKWKENHAVVTFNDYRL